MAPDNETQGPISVRKVADIPVNPGIPLDWENINTDFVSGVKGRRHSDEDLLEGAKHCEILSGWGVLAEICKRFAALRTKKE